MAPSRGAFPAGSDTGQVPKLSQPLQLFMLALIDIVDSRLVEKASPIGWRYVVVGDQPVAIAEIRLSGDQTTPTFSGLSYGRSVERLALSAEVAERNFQATSEIFEARILEIPSLYVSTLWLHGARDIFIPYLEATVADRPPREEPDFVLRVLDLAAQARIRPLGDVDTAP